MSDTLKPPYEVAPIRMSLLAKTLNIGVPTIVQSFTSKGYKVDANPNAKLNSSQLLVLAQNFNRFDILGIDNYLYYYEKLNFELLDLSSFYLEEMIAHKEKIDELNVKKIKLSSARIKDFSFLKDFTQLEFLTLSSNQISDISFLSTLTKLQSLRLSSNQIFDISCISLLTRLELLSLNSNPISDYSWLASLTGLTSLELYNNRITDIGFLSTLTSLKSLDLSSNKITEYSLLSRLPSLESLDLSDNQISDYSFLAPLTGLKSLALCNNQISDISFLSTLTGLKSLDIRHNQISNIKPLLPLLKTGLNINLEKERYWQLNNEIGLKNNPITDPSLEIVIQGREKVIEYFEGKRKPLNECKLIFVGDGRVGKTSLMRRVVFDKFDKDEKTTHGINKIAWEEIRNDRSETVRVNLWDFGGQHIQHSLHQFFFTERVVYVLVLNPGNDQKANYWLDQIEKLGCDSEILIAYNWKQEEDKQADFLTNFYELRKKYPKLPEPFLLSCQTGEGVESFKKALITSVLRNEGLKAEYLVTWFNIKQRLEKEVSIGKNYITYETYQEWCKEEDYNEADRQKSLLKILDSIGSIVFFDKPILNQLQVLNPEWLTTGAYAILVAEKTRTNKGHLSWEDLKEIFKEKKEIFSNKEISIKYNENQFQFIIELMLQYDLCQRNPFKANDFLIPSVFGEKQNKDYEKEKVDARHYRLQFDSPFEMLIIHRFIAKNLLKITGKDYWQSGIYIKHPDSQTFALVETNLYSKRIDCWIKGENIRGFWEVIRADFREILSIYHKFAVKEEVLYEKDGREVFLPYDEMLNSLRNGVSLIPYHPTYQLVNIDVLAVIDLFEDKNQTQQAMGNEKGVNINIQNNPHFEQKTENKNIVNLKVDVSSLKEFEEIKELLLDLEEANVKNEDWKNALIKALDEFYSLEVAEEKAKQRKSIDIIERAFKKLKDLKDIVTIGLLPVDIDKKLPDLFTLWETFKSNF